MSSPIEITLAGTGADDFLSAINGKVDSSAAIGSTTKLINIKASKLTTGEIVIEHSQGGDFRMNNTSR